jgi:UDP-3-O-[3-hydroxymyristoyl] glucosamine N-acyltransferase
VRRALPGAGSTAEQVAERVGGELVGPDRAIAAVATIEAAESPDLAYLERGNPGAGGVLLAKHTLPGRTVVVVADPLAALCQLLEDWFPEPAFEGAVHPTATVHPTAVLDPGVVVGAFCVVAQDAHLFPNVVLYPRTRIGRGCRIHAGSVIGADGFRYHATARGPLRVPQVGGVVLGDAVDIGANCTIDRGFIGDTVLGDGCKLDNLVHVGHNCTLGRFVIVAAQTGISGSVRIGDGVLIGGQVGVADHTIIEDGARIGAQSGLHGTIPAGETWLGTPALPIATMRRVYALTRDLPAMWRAWRPDKPSS